MITIKIYTSRKSERRRCACILLRIHVRAGASARVVRRAENRGSFGHGVLPPPPPPLMLPGPRGPYLRDDVLRLCDCVCWPPARVFVLLPNGAFLCARKMTAILPPRGTYAVPAAQGVPPCAVIRGACTAEMSGSRPPPLRRRRRHRRKYRARTPTYKMARFKRCKRPGIAWRSL